MAGHSKSHCRCWCDVFNHWCGRHALDHRSRCSRSRGRCAGRGRRSGSGVSRGRHKIGLGSHTLSLACGCDARRKRPRIGWRIVRGATKLADVFHVFVELNQRHGVRVRRPWSPAWVLQRVRTSQHLCKNTQIRRRNFPAHVIPRCAHVGCTCAKRQGLEQTPPNLDTHQFVVSCRHSNWRICLLTRHAHVEEDVLKHFVGAHKSVQRRVFKHGQKSNQSSQLFMRARVTRANCFQATYKHKLLSPARHFPPRSTSRLLLPTEPTRHDRSPLEWLLLGSSKKEPVAESSSIPSPKQAPKVVSWLPWAQAVAVAPSSGCGGWKKNTTSTLRRDWLQQGGLDRSDVPKRRFPGRTGAWPRPASQVPKPETLCQLPWSSQIELTCKVKERVCRI